MWSLLMKQVRHFLSIVFTMQVLHITFKATLSLNIVSRPTTMLTLQKKVIAFKGSGSHLQPKNLTQNKYNGMLK